MFDSTIGASTVLMPFGGKHQLTESQAGVQKLPVLHGHTNTASILAFGYNPYIASFSPFHGAMYAVLESMAKIVAVGGDYKKIRFTFQEYFEKLGKDTSKWGVARRIPDGYISGHANQARITTFPLRDGKTSITNKDIDKMIFNPDVETVYAADVISFAKLKGYYDPKAPDAQFSFCDAYAPVDFEAARFCESRVWAAFYRCNPDLMAQYEDYARGDNLSHRFPLWIKPAKKVDVTDVMQLMRDHFEGTSMDMTQDIGAGPFACPYRWRPMTWEYNGKEYIHERATATQQTGFSFVAQARSWLPDKFGGIFWFGVDDAASSCYIPMFCGITEIPEAVREGNGSMVDYSSTAAFWIFTKVSQLVYTRY